MATSSRPPSAPPAIVQSEEQAELQQSHATWAALATFHRAPCLRESLATGGAGGVAIFALRWLSTRSAGGPAPIAAAATWGGFAGALVFGANAYVCRRALHADLRKRHEETELIQRAAQGDVEAIRAMQARLGQTPKGR